MSQVRCRDGSARDESKVIEAGAAVEEIVIVGICGGAFLTAEMVRVEEM